MYFNKSARLKDVSILLSTTPFKMAESARISVLSHVNVLYSYLAEKLFTKKNGDNPVSLICICKIAISLSYCDYLKSFYVFTKFSIGLDYNF